MTTAAVTAVDPMALGALAAHARELLERDHWSREQLADYQRDRLCALLRHAVQRSSYYREALGPGAEEADLGDLPTLPKALMMEQFDRIVVDRRLRLSELEPSLPPRMRGPSTSASTASSRPRGHRVRPACSSTRSRSSLTGSR